MYSRSLDMLWWYIGVEWVYMFLTSHKFLTMFTCNCDFWQQDGDERFNVFFNCPGMIHSARLFDTYYTSLEADTAT